MNWNCQVFLLFHEIDNVKHLFYFSTRFVICELFSVKNLFELELIESVGVDARILLSSSTLSLFGLRAIGCFSGCLFGSEVGAGSVWWIFRCFSILLTCQYYKCTMCVAVHKYGNQNILYRLLYQSNLLRLEFNFSIEMLLFTQKFEIFDINFSFNLFCSASDSKSSSSGM